MAWSFLISRWPGWDPFIKIFQTHDFYFPFSRMHQEAWNKHNILKGFNCIFQGSFINPNNINNLQVVGGCKHLDFEFIVIDMSNDTCTRNDSFHQRNRHSRQIFKRVDSRNSCHPRAHHQPLIEIARMQWTNFCCWSSQTSLQCVANSYTFIHNIAKKGICNRIVL